MTTIVSRSSRERIVRTLLLLIILSGFGAAYLWDGYIGYARANVAGLLRSQGRDPKATTITLNLTAARGREIAELFESRSGGGDPVSALGPPSIEHEGDSYFVGPGGWLRARRENGRVVEIAWADAPHTETDQLWQRWIGWTLGIAALAWSVHAVRVLRFRAVLSDGGLTIGGKKAIPFDAMTALRADPSRRINVFELEHRGGNATRTVTLNAYEIRELPAMIREICERKEFATPSTLS